jgi:N-acetylglucosaminyldiphosphoundecaprenol N-acetyl-beta-D-mannosaminyltransferase
VSKQAAWPKYEVLGVSIDAVTMADATRHICDLASNPDAPACYVTKPYSQFLDAAAADPAVRRYLNESELCLADGVALCWATVFRYGGANHWWRIITTGAGIVLRPRSAYRFLPEKFAGANATWALLAEAEKRGLRVFLMGSPKGSTLDNTVAAIHRRHPRLEIAGLAPGEAGGLRGAALRSALENGLDVTPLARQIERSHADIILIGIGFPLQEALMSRLATTLRHGVMVGEGGTFDYRSFGGRTPRAPGWIQRLGLEWLWRLVLDPRRIKRQLSIPRLIWKVYREPRT